MPLKIAYLLLRWLFGLTVLVFRGDRAKDAELLVVRHEALIVRMEVEDLRRLAVAAVG
ncbi:MAG TPA: hypothetical protein VIJ82_03290 [Streptosporangiaceae bacterium]